MSENWERFDPQSRHWRVIDGGARPKPAPSIGAAVRAERRRRIDWWCRFASRCVVSYLMFVAVGVMSGSSMTMFVAGVIGALTIVGYGYGQPKP